MMDIAKHLQVGQFVCVEALAHGFQITVLEDQHSNLSIVAIGSDYVVLDDPDMGVRTRIPSHLIKLGPAEPTELVPQAA